MANVSGSILFPNLNLFNVDAKKLNTQAIDGVNPLLHLKMLKPWLLVPIKSKKVLSRICL